MSEQATPMAEPMESPLHLTHDTPCIHCGYNLRGLNSDGRCPECGAAILDSTRGDLLRFADAGWLESLKKGATLKLINVLLGVFGGIVGALLSRWLPMIPVPKLIGIAGAAVGVWATFLITRQEPRISLAEDPVTLRRIIRACAVLSLAGLFVPEFIAMTGEYLASDFGVILVVGLRVLLALVGVVVLFGELVYLRRFSLRIPDEKLAKSTTIVLWLLPLAWGAVFVIAAVVQATTAPFPARGGTGRVGDILLVILLFASLLLILAAASYIGLLVRYRRAFATAAVESRSAAVA